VLWGCVPLHRFDISQVPLSQVAMDCREFRKQHFAYLDDTMPGDDMAAAQRHIMSCDNCAAHDTMVRRSLMLVRNMSVIEPSVEFRQRMQERLSQTRAETQREKFLLAEREAVTKPRLMVSQPLFMTAVAATVLVAGAVVWHQQQTLTPSSMVSMQSAQPIEPSASLASASDTTQQEIYLAPGIVQAMATGNPMWPAALMVDDAAAHFVNTGFQQVKATR
jgi:hypothetical protein